MKSRYLPFALVLLAGSSFTLNAQWTSLGAHVPASGHKVWGLEVVGDDLIWGLTHTNTGPEYSIKSLDGGATWAATPIDIPSSLYAFHIFPLNESTAWLATSDEGNPISGKIFKTTDGGETWMEQSTGFTGFNETPAGVYFWDENEGVAFGATGLEYFDDQISVYWTDDGGGNWNKALPPDFPGQLPHEGLWVYCDNGFFDVQGDNVWFVTNGPRIYRSTDRGKTWTAHDTGLTNAYGIAGIAFKDALNGIVVAASPNAAARTVDGGITWEQIGVPTSPLAIDIVYVPGTDGTYVLHNASTNSASPLTLVTYDDGDTWGTLSTGPNFDCMEFKSPTLGFAGGAISSTISGIYKWAGSPLRKPIFVDDSAAGNNNGASWANAFNDLQDALAIASDGGQIWVAEGLYLPGDTPTATFLMDKNIHLYGGFVGTENFLSERGGPADHPTILTGDVNGDDVADDFVANRGDNVMTVVEIAPGISNATVIDGFTIRNGHADGAWPQGKGAGILSTGAPVIRNCLFTQNYAEEQGGAILHNTASTQSIIIEACIFDKNAGRFGGAVDVYHSGYRIDNCTFSGNVAEWELGNGVGGGLLINGASGAITNCTFENNAADKGGGIFVSSWVDVNDVTLVLENSTFNGNTAAVSGGGLGLVLTDSIQAVVRNCIFQNNSCVSGAGVGISVFEGGDFTENADILFENCLMAGNEGEEGTIHLSKAGTLKLLNCTIAGNPAGGIVQDENSALALQNTILYNPGFTEYAGADGNVTATSLGGNFIGDDSFAAHALPQDLQPMYDPQAMFMGADDYHLHPGSPCINRGINDGVTALYDLEGNGRIQHGIVDIGAYESPFVASAREAIVGEIGLSPNPATDFLYLQLPENIAQPVEVGLFDASGKMVGSQVLTTGQPLGLQGLVPGMYWVKVVLDGQVYTGKFSKF